ncbi:hypothetical protein L6452_34320 [Arctium lappa]|uniref:Uncharacterized protein n=1 Tax=Arctium lappa TaxID=4217 RepID=A0ACB8YH89_ARCLA|nr:hypothetical protein L6452_34320 [Arctium lappa]
MIVPRARTGLVSRFVAVHVNQMAEVYRRERATMEEKICATQNRHQPHYPSSLVFNPTEDEDEEHKTNRLWLSRRIDYGFNLTEDEDDE